ncbi:MAG: hypothetical protein ACJ8M4_10520 [Chthoniobacterales bacterium]
MIRFVYCHLIGIVFLLTAASPYASAAVEPKATVVETSCEGFSHKELSFKDGDRRVSYELPDKWNYRGENGIQLTVPDKPFAEALIRMAPLPKPQPLEEKDIEAAKQRFLASLPPGAQMVKLVEEEANPLILNNSPSYEFTVSYKVMGETFLRSALFTNVFDTQFVFVFTARTSDFDVLHRAFRSSLVSWQWRENQPAVVAQLPGPVAK